jgi:hypothetical protein
VSFPRSSRCAVKGLSWANMASRVAAVGEDGRETRLLFRDRRGGGLPLPRRLASHGRPPCAGWLRCVARSGSTCASKEKVLGSFPVVALKCGQGQGSGRHQGAAQPAPIGRHDGPAPDTGVSKVHPSSPAPAVLGRDLKHVAVWRAFADPLGQPPEALALPLANRFVFAVFQPFAASL